MSKTRTVVIIGTALSLSLGACTLDDRGFSRSESVITADPSSLLVLESTVGGVVSKAIAVSGRGRADVPRPHDWSCGQPLREYAISNVAWLELMNTSSNTLAVSIELIGLAGTHPNMFVYGTKHARLTDCLTFSFERKLGGNSSVVVQPSSSVYVLVSAGAATGIYTASVTTEQVIEP